MTPPPAPRQRPVAPLDPSSPKGKEVAARLSEVLADVRASIAARKAREAAAKHTT